MLPTPKDPCRHFVIGQMQRSFYDVAQFSSPLVYDLRCSTAVASLGSLSGLVDVKKCF